MQPQNQKSLAEGLAELGTAIARSGVIRWFYATGEGRQMASILLVVLPLVAAWGAWTLWRRSSWAGMQAMYKDPQKMRAWYGPWRGPLLVLPLAVLALVAIPGYLPRMARIRPQGWPDLFVLSPKWAFPAMVVALALGVLALIIGLRRSLHEKVLTSSHGDAAWASRTDIVVPADPRIVMPFLVSYRGTVKDWKQGLQPPRPKGALEASFQKAARFVPNINTAGLTPICLQDETLWEHVLITGHTGSGKGIGLFNAIMFSALVSPRPIPFIYQDFKAECPGHNRLWSVTGLEPIRFGRAARGGWPSMRWSPLREALADENPPLAVNDLLAILAPNEGPGDFVSPPSRNVLSHLILSAGYENFHEIRDAVMHKGLLKLLEETKAPAGLVNALTGKNMEQYVSDKIFAVTTPYSVGWGRAVSSGHDFSIADIFKRGGYVLSAETEPMLALPIKVFWRFVLRYALQSSPDSKFGVLLLYDEFLASGKIDNLAQALQTLRSRQVSIWAGIQARSGVLSNYKAVEGKEVLDGFKSEIMLLNGLCLDDRKHLMEFLGTRTVVEGKGKNRDYKGQPLLAVADLNRRASRSRDFWAVFRTTGLSRSGRPVLAKAIPTVGRDFVVPPSPEELNEALKLYGDVPPLTCSEAAEVARANAIVTSGTAPAPVLKPCAHCAAGIPEGVIHCPSCGAPIEVAEIPEERPDDDEEDEPSNPLENLFGETH